MNEGSLLTYRLLILSYSLQISTIYNKGRKNVVEWEWKERGGVEERLLLRASYRCIYRTLRQPIKFSPKPIQTKNTIYMCVCLCAVQKPQFCYSDENLCHIARSPLKILKGKLYEKGAILTSEFSEFMDFFRRMSKLNTLLHPYGVSSQLC